MTIETELKYQILTNSENSHIIVSDISALLKAQNISFEMEKSQLINDYFDNDDLALRKMDFGLRIRAKGALYEQTIKTAGKVVGCLHQRPEYNINIPEPKLNLALFPLNIWPKNINVLALQQSLKVIFSTNFSRQTWLLHQGENIIELALDQGDIFTASESPSLAINEIEIELVSGNEQALFTLAEQLQTVIAMEPSELSKAARGYTLFYDEMNR